MAANKTFFAGRFSGAVSFLAIACLVGCNGLATSRQSSATSSASSLRIATPDLPAATIQNGHGDEGKLTDTIQPPNGRIAKTAPTAFSFATRSMASAPSTHPSSAPLQIKAQALRAGTVQNDYDTKLVATGGVPPYFWDATAGQIAPGLTLRSAAGTISGIPFAPGPFSFTVRVQDSTGSSLSTTVSLNIFAAPPAISAVLPDTRTPDSGTVAMTSDR